MIGCSSNNARGSYEMNYGENLCDTLYVRSFGVNDCCCILLLMISYIVGFMTYVRLT